MQTLVSEVERARSTERRISEVTTSVASHLEVASLGDANARMSTELMGIISERLLHLHKATR
jgi:hypothetical protein